MEGSGDGGAGGQDLRSELLQDPRTPLGSSSPGWTRPPAHVRGGAGKNVSLQCRNGLPHRNTIWLLNGREDITTSALAQRVVLGSGNQSLTFGPLQSSDQEILVGCLIATQEYGDLPAPLGSISVVSKSVVSGNCCLLSSH